MGAPWKSPGVLGGPLGDLRGSLGSSLGVLEGLLGVLGWFWKSLQNHSLFITSPGIEAPLRNIWDVFGGPCALLGGPCAPLQPSLRLSGASLGHLGDPWVALGGPWYSLGVLRGVYGVQRGSLGDGSGNPEVLGFMHLSGPSQTNILDMIYQLSFLYY